MPDLPTGTVTFLFTDIEGSTRLLKSLGARYAEALEEHQRILRAAFEEAGGREIDTQGDAFFVAFSRAKDAATAALAAQSGLLAHEWPEGARVRVRMGLHTAEPVVGEERYIGLGVHRAARICAAGHGGQVLLSGATQALVEDDLPAGARLLDLGHHRLKDFDRTEHIFQLVGDGLPTDFPALKTLAGQPDEATPFSGREDTLAAAAQAAVETGRWSRRRISAVLLALLAIAGAIVAVIALLGGGATSSVTVVPDSLAVVDPVANRIVYDMKPLGEGPGPIGVGDDGLWILSLNSKTLASVDPRTRELRSTQGIGGNPTNMAVGGREVWISDSCNSNTNPALIRYEHGLSENIEEVSLPPASGEAKPTQTVACGLAASGESVWAGLTAPASIVHASVDPALNLAKTVDVVPLAGQANAIGLGEGAVWVANYPNNIVRRIDPRNGKVTASIRVGSGPIAISVAGGAVWVVNQNDGSVSRIDPRTNSVIKAISVGAAPSSVAAGAGAVWVANAGDGTISRIDLQANVVSSTISVGHRPQGIAVANGYVWVTVRR
jgi:YVTN family beta-propeller protein